MSERIVLRREREAKHGKWQEIESAEFKGNNAEDQLVTYIKEKYGVV